MKAEELLKKLNKLNGIYSLITAELEAYDVYVRMSIIKNWRKRKEKIQLELINQFKTEACSQQRHICQVEMDKDSVQVNGKWYVSCEGVLNASEPE